MFRGGRCWDWWGGGESGGRGQEGGAARSAGREGDTPVELQPWASGITSHTLLLLQRPKGTPEVGLTARLPWDTSWGLCS